MSFANNQAMIIPIIWIWSLPYKFWGSSSAFSAAKSAVWFSLMESSLISDVKAAFSSQRSIQWYPLQYRNCESFSTKYLDPCWLCKWTPRNNENRIISYRGHSHDMIDWPVAFFLSGFLSQTLIIYRTAREGMGPAFIPLFHFHLLTNIETFICNLACEMTISYF